MIQMVKFCSHSQNTKAFQKLLVYLINQHVTESKDRIFIISKYLANLIPALFQLIISKFRKMIQIAHCDLHQKCKMKKKMMMFTESLAAQAESRLLCILLVCVPKRWKCLYMSMMIAATPSHAH